MSVSLTLPLNIGSTLILLLFYLKLMIFISYLLYMYMCDQRRLIYFTCILYNTKGIICFTCFCGIFSAPWNISLFSNHTLFVIAYLTIVTAVKWIGNVCIYICVSQARRILN